MIFLYFLFVDKEHKPSPEDSWEFFSIDEDLGLISINPKRSPKVGKYIIYVKASAGQQAASAKVCYIKLVSIWI